MKKFTRKLTVLSAAMCITAAGSAFADTTSFGDVTGDGVINVRDMEAIQKSILKISTLTDEEQNNADVDRNGIITVTDMEAVQKDILSIEKIENLSVIDQTVNNVSVHDPSVVKDEKTGTYYIFGSHMAWAKSKDLVNWTTFTNNINRDFKTLFAKEAEWSAKGSTTYDVSGNLWAPDVIWNEAMGKWCMYMSVNGDNWYTSIVLLTADSLDGDWTYVGPVVYSGFTSAEEAALTDYSKAAGTFDAAAQARYTQNRNGNHTYGMNAIDPCVIYDEEGNLWMTYGSWFGGIYMLKLDGSTGLRDYSYQYQTVAHESDIYQGLKIAGGNHVSGEASYIQKVGDYYYLFMSYGGLTANGGYNMRVFRSDKITGPYKDYTGDDARYSDDNKGVGVIGGTVGVRLMTQYKWNTMDVAQVAQGHNSAFVDSDGKAYVVYHTRTNDGTEGHYVKTHQLFLNEEGWLVAAPYKYSGETLNTKGYSQSQVAGTYDVILHEQSVDYENLKYVSPVEVTLNSDGTVSGKYSGTWSLTSGTPYVTIEMNNQTYKGVVIRQIIEGTDEDTMCLTLLGTDEKEVWFSKQLRGKRATAMAQDKLVVAQAALDDLALPTEGMYGTKITWTSDHPEVIAADGTLTKPKQETVVTLTATFENNGYKQSKQYKVTVYEAAENETEPYVIAKYYMGEKVDLTNAGQGTYALANPFNSANTSGLELYNGAAIEFDVELTGDLGVLGNIIGFTDNGGGKLYFTGGSYLGYNATGGFYDANLGTGYTLGKDFLGKSAHVRIDFLPAGYQVSVNGQVAYTNKDVDAKTISGSNSITGYNNVLKWLNTSSTTLNLGWGNWWSDARYNGTISNIVCYAYPVEKIDTSGYEYYQDFRKGDLSEWGSANALKDLGIVDDGDAHGNYMKFSADAGVSGNRGAYAGISAAVSENYTIETDVKITAGNVKDRSASQFVIATTGTDAAEKNNNGVTKGYLVKLSAGPNSTEYAINDGSDTVTIPADTWVTVKAVVTTGNTVALTITNQSTGAVLYSGNVTANASTELKGLYLLRGRGTGTTSVDNIKVSNNNE